MKEHTIEGYKSDLYIEDTNTIVEIKSILCFDEEAAFPTVYSQRAISQLLKICLLLDKGYNVYYVLVSLNSNVKRIILNTMITDFWEVFNQCLNKGMKVKGVSLKIKNEEPVVCSNTTIIIEPSTHVCLSRVDDNE